MEPQKRKKLNPYPNHHQQLIKNQSENRDHVPDHQDQLEIKVTKIEIKAMIIEVQAMIIEIEVMIVEIIEIKVMTVEIEAMIVEIEAEGGFTRKEKVTEKDLEVQGTAMIQIGGQMIVISVGKNPQHRRGRN